MFNPFVFLLACAQEPIQVEKTVHRSSSSDGLVKEPVDADQAETSQPANEPTTEPAAEPNVCEQTTGDSDNPLDLQGREECGESIYLIYCASCHGATGQGTSAGQQLRGHVDHHSDEELLFTIVNGEGEMPGFSILSAQELADLLAYMRDQFFGNNPVE